MVVHSRDLFQHLSGCDEAVLFAATLGAPVRSRGWSAAPESVDEPRGGDAGLCPRPP